MEKSVENTIDKSILTSAAFQAILNATEDYIFVKDMNLIYVAASMPFVRITGQSDLDDVIGKKDADIFENPMLAKKYVMDDYKLMTSGQNMVNYIEPLPDEVGQARYGTTSKYILKDDNGNNIGILGITKDITTEYLARQRYQTELKYLFELPKNTYAVSYIDVDDWRIITQRRQKIHNVCMQACLSVEELCEAAIESIVDEESKAVLFYKEFQPGRLKAIYESGQTSISFTYQRRLSDWSIHWIHNEIKFLMDMDSGHLCVMLSAQDIDEEKKTEQKLIEAAKRDQMTKLYNRETTMNYIKQTLMQHPDDMHALFMLDVDNFKNLNDTLGHQTGDEFLVELAEVLQASFRETDVVGRIGGDEFFAFMGRIHDQEVIERKAEELIHNVRKVCANYEIVDLSGSIGISLYPKHGTTVEELYAKADAALYQAKRRGKNQSARAE